MTADSDGDKELDDYFLNDEVTTYGEPPGMAYDVNSMITSAKLLRFLSLGIIRQKKNSKTSWSKISKSKMIKGLADTTVRYVKNYIKQNNLSNTCDKLDPIMERAANFCMEPFLNLWTRRLGHGKLYGVSYINLYKEEL